MLNQNGVHAAGRDRTALTAPQTDAQASLIKEMSS
jgi:hypothetical protein